MIALYTDENVEGQIIRSLRARGVDLLTVEEDRYIGAPDAIVMDRATELGRVSFSRDTDFLREGASRQRNLTHFTGVIYAHKLDVSIGQCVTDLEFLCEAGEPADFVNRVYFLPL